MRNNGHEIIKIMPGGDLSEVLLLRKEIFGYGEDDLDDYGINILLKESGNGAAIGRILLDPENDRLIIDQIGVKEELRRKGLGTEMLIYLEGIAKDSRSDEVRAKAKSNRAAVALLSKQGFEEYDYFWMIKEL